ncbi:GNAT family N-acetyltransferase [Nocardioides sp. Arc9.136]|uniref:GNAT family N-acetyltransferase n=1 Tax=Nocardioides sp. Arc9.136 TaxID=2996826 RepID=UPI002666D77B|nr:GNAT family N-acetyltransferase [Nocardioides sp. Arc9.136]WKN50098.1 GNAT family N-acetyltransferase [Nocardioides sp. Arc9.136]
MTPPDRPAASGDPLELTVRPAEPADATALAAVHLRARRAAPMPDSPHPDATLAPFLATRIGADEVWVAEAGERVVGYARHTGTWLDDLYVEPTAARRGVGSVLLEVVKERLPDGFCLWVFESNAPARAFYARHGLVALERTDGSANEERSPDVRMAWPGRDPVAFLRSLVDEVDVELGDLLARRAALTRAIQPLKPDAARDPARERQVAERVARRAPELGTERLVPVVDAIITASLDAAR